MDALIILLILLSVSLLSSSIVSVLLPMFASKNSSVGPTVLPTLSPGPTATLSPDPTATLSPGPTATLSPTPTLSPAPVYSFMAVGADSRFYKRAGLDASSSWVLVEPEDTTNLRSVAQLGDGSIIAVGQDNKVWKKRTNSAGWDKFIEDGWVSQISVRKDGQTIIGIGGQDMYTIAPPYTSWTKVPKGSCCVKSAVELQSGSIVAVGTDNKLYVKDSIDSNDWKKLDDNGEVTSITVADGKILGVGPDGKVYRRPADAGAVWESLGDHTGYVLSVSPLK